MVLEAKFVEVFDWNDLHKSTQQDIIDMILVARNKRTKNFLITILVYALQPVVQLIVYMQLQFSAQKTILNKVFVTNLFRTTNGQSLPYVTG